MPALKYPVNRDRKLKKDRPPNRAMFPLGAGVDARAAKPAEDALGQEQQSRKQNQERHEF